MNYPNHSFFGAVQTNNSEYSNSSNQEWTRHENKLFENALAELDLNSPALYEKLMVALPWKTLEQIKSHYEKLIADVAMIERGEISSPNYGDRVDGVDHKRKGAPWTDEEHRLFLIGLDKLGKGEWRNISRYYVKTKTPSQVASHGQKYFRRLKCCTPLDKRRYSIHDIRILNSAIVETSARHPNRHSFITHIPQHDQPNYLAHKKDTVHEQHYSSSVEVTTNAGTANSNNIIGTTSLISSSNNNNSLMIMGNDIAHIGYDQCADYDEFFQPFAMLN